MLTLLQPSQSQHHQEAREYLRTCRSACLLHPDVASKACLQHVFFSPSGRNHSLPALNVHHFRRIDWTRWWRQEVYFENILKHSGSILPPHRKTLFDLNHKGKSGHKRGARPIYTWVKCGSPETFKACELGSLLANKCILIGQWVFLFNPCLWSHLNSACHILCTGDQMSQRCTLFSTAAEYLSLCCAEITSMVETNMGLD